MRIGCIIVLYNPNLSIFEKVLNSISNQVDLIFIADNSPIQIDEKLIGNNRRILYKKMSGNIGIAAAQNIGIKYFTGLNFTHVIFLDQDSIPETNLISLLVEDLNYLLEKKINVGAIGPRPINRENNKKYKAKIDKGTKLTKNITEVNQLISSASLVSIMCYKEIGLLEEELFIDGVDHEWCWRAKKIGKLRFFISEKAHLSHKLGEGDRFFIIRNVAIPTPFRTYYQFRNYFILARRQYVPFYWKISNGIKYFIKFFYYPIFLNNRKEYFVNISRGIKDGLLHKNLKQNIS